MKNIFLILTLLNLLVSFGQNDCKPYKKTYDEFLDKEVITWGAKFGAERSLFLGTSVATYLTSNKINDDTYKLSFTQQYSQKTNDASVNNINYPKGTQFLLKTSEGIKSFTSTSALNKKNLIASNTLTVSSISVEIDKSEMQFFVNNPILSYRVVELSGNMSQGTVDDSKAYKVQQQFACMLNETPPPARTDENTGNSKNTNAKSKQDSINTTNRHKFQLGKTYLNDLIVPSNYSGINRFQVEYSYLKKFDKLLGLEIAAGLTTSFRKEKVSGQSLREHVLYVMPKLNIDILNKNKFNLFANAGLGFGLDSYTSKLSTSSEKSKVRFVRFLYDLNIGVNYFVNDYFGLTASAGFPTTMFKIGIVKRIK